jgi:peptide/nickel transport system permease protein
MFRIGSRWKETRVLLRMVVLCSIMVGMLSYPAVALSDSAHGAGAVAWSSALMQDEPVANATADRTTVYVGDTVHFNASASVPSSGAEITNYTWNFSYGGVTRIFYGVAPNYTFDMSVVKAALMEINMTVTDSNNRSAWTQLNIVVKEKPKSFLEAHWLDIVIIGIILVIVARYTYPYFRRVVDGLPIVTEAEKEKFKLNLSRGRKIMKQLLKNRMGLIGVVILIFFGVLAIVGPYIIPYDVKTIGRDPSTFMNPPSAKHWLGTDNFGIDIFSELLYGARTSIIVGMVSAVIASFLGALVGLYSGYVGGWKDEVVMRLNDIVLSIPWLVLMIVTAGLLGKIDLTGIILIIGLTGWSTTARMVRAQVLSIRERQYIERARAIGASEMNIIRRHVFPNTFPLVFANTILTVAVSILSEATLSFLGMRPAGEVTWGTMLSFAQESSAFQNGLMWWILAPGLCIVIVVLGFTLLGYALDEILNPKLRHR